MFTQYHFNLDAQIIQVPLKSTGLVNVGDSYVHIGFLYAYNVVASSVLRTVKAQKAAYPSYTIIVTGHSLGAAVAALAAVSIKSALPSSNLKLYTFGQPRTGNAAFATYVENLIGINNIFRAVHTYGAWILVFYLVWYLATDMSFQMVYPLSCSRPLDTATCRETFITSIPKIVLIYNEQRKRVLELCRTRKRRQH